MYYQEKRVPHPRNMLNREKVTNEKKKMQKN